MAEPLPPEAGRWLLTLSGGYPDGIWCCSACMAPLTEGAITHEGGCPDAAPAIRAAERERCAKLADIWETTYPVECHASWCAGNGKHGVHRIEFGQMLRELGDEPAPCESQHVLNIGEPT